MMDDFIQLNKPKILRLGIKDSDGNDTGEFLEFDLEDTSLPMRYQELLERHKKNVFSTKNKIKIISKKQDVNSKGKLYTKNEEETLIALEDFFKEEEKVYDMFLGENGVKKLLNGRKLGWTSLKEIDEIIDKYIIPKLNIKMKDIEDDVINKYNIKNKKDDGILR